MFRKSILSISLLLGLLFGAAACGSASVSKNAQPGGLKIVATTTIVGDVVRQIAGEQSQVTTLLPIGADPHSFQPTPQDVVKVADAGVIFSNGAGLEEFLQPLLKNAGSKAEVFPVSENIQLLDAQGPHASDHPGGDPHTWFDPNNVIAWTQVIEQKLSALDPANAQTYAANAQAYRQKLTELDTWIQDQVYQIPGPERQLVSDHTVFTYFAQRYGFTQDGAILPGYSTMAEPSAKELASLEDAIRSLGVKAVFVGETANSSLAERVAKDTSTQLVFLYTGSLSAAEGPASSYLDLMRYDVSEIVKALK